MERLFRGVSPADAGLGGRSRPRGTPLFVSAGGPLGPTRGTQEGEMSKKLLLVVLALLALGLGFIATAEIELREDFSGTGEFQARSDLYGVKDRATTRDANLVYGHVFAKSNSFSGFKAQGGESTYSVGTRDHQLQIRDASEINATARITQTVLEFGGDERFTFFSAQGNGTVLESAFVDNLNRSRMEEVYSIFHCGPFSLNSSVRVATATVNSTI